MVSSSIPQRVGVGLKLEHYPAIANSLPDIGWFEVHAENFMVAGGPRLRLLEHIRHHYPLSLHGIGLSLGGVERPDPTHLAALRQLIDRFSPGLVSEHLAWSSAGGTYFADLLPLPLNASSLALVARNIEIAQDHLKCRILIENPSNYLAFTDADLPEQEFLAGLVQRTGCGLLLDVNNLHISHWNIGIDIDAYLAGLPQDALGEIHLAGHVVEAHGSGDLLIDTHSTAVTAPVRAVFEHVIQRFGPRPTLIEWDNDLPEWDVLLAEARTAGQMLDRVPVDA